MHTDNLEDNNIKATTLPKNFGRVVALILVVVGTSTSGMMHYHHTEALGSIRVMDDYQGFGYAAYTYTYDAYGTRSCSVFACPPYNPFGYTGQYTDDESGMLYLRARYYDPTTQQFISRDPASAGGGSGQPYTYAGGNPVNFADPTGNWPDGPGEAIPLEPGGGPRSPLEGRLPTTGAGAAIEGGAEGGSPLARDAAGGPVPIRGRLVGGAAYNRETGQGLYVYTMIASN